MDNQENLLIILFVSLIVLACGFLWLLNRYKKLKQEFELLQEVVERNNHDIAGLCSAAATVDNRLSVNNRQLTEVEEKIAGFEQHQQPDQPYYIAIQKVRQGASADELIKQCGLSREEAMLLIRLHGS